MTLDSVPLHMTALRWMGDVEHSTLHIEINNGNLNRVVCLCLSFYTYKANINYNHVALRTVGLEISVVKILIFS